MLSTKVLCLYKKIKVQLFALETDLEKLYII